MPHATGETFRHRAQHFVASLVPEAVVDILESIQIEKQDRDEFAAALRPLDRLRQRLLEKAAIRQAGQLIVVRQKTGALFRLLPGGDVLQDP